MTQWRVTPDGEKQWQGSDGFWYSSEAAASGARAGPAPQRPVPSPPTVYQRPGKTAAATKAKRRQIGCLVPIVVVIVIIVIVAVTNSGSGGGAKVAGRVTNVGALDGNTIRIYVDWTNSGKAAGSASCAFNTTVHNQFGDEVNIRVNSTATNHPVKPGQSELQYQDIGVDNGDAQYVTKKDVTITNC